MDAELRFPLIDAMLTPLGVLGGLRGVFFANAGVACFNTVACTPYTSGSETFRPILSADANGTPIYGPPTTLSGFRLKDARASYGVGLETFILGLPMHFDWSWRTLFNPAWEDIVFALDAAQDGVSSGSQWFRQPQFSFWIGYDF
jgi:hypothetical protein